MFECGHEREQTGRRKKENGHDGVENGEVKERERERMGGEKGRMDRAMHTRGTGRALRTSHNQGDKCPKTVQCPADLKMEQQDVPSPVQGLALGKHLACHVAPSHVAQPARIDVPQPDVFEQLEHGSG